MDQLSLTRAGAGRRGKARPHQAGSAARVDCTPRAYTAHVPLHIRSDGGVSGHRVSRRRGVVYEFAPFHAVAANEAAAARASHVMVSDFVPLNSDVHHSSLSDSHTVIISRRRRRLDSSAFFLTI